MGEDAGDGKPHRVSIRNWIESNMNWSWFTCTQSTGGIAVMLSECPKSFKALETIGTIIFIFNIVLWLVFTTLMMLRWILGHGQVKRSFTDAPECFFFGSFWLSLATMLINMQQYGYGNVGDWLVVAVRVLFWMYAAISLLTTSIHTVVIFQKTHFVAIEMNPASFLVILNAMLTGTVASTIAMDQPPHQRIPILVAGVAFQGFGWVVSMFLLAWHVGHLLEKGLPPASARPGLFMPVGTAGYTIVALIGLSRAIPEGYGYFGTHPMASEILQVLATWTGIFLWLVAFWLFAIAFCACIAVLLEHNPEQKSRWPMRFNNAWWGLIFPNVGFTIATTYLGQELESNAIEWISVAMILVVVAVWLLNLILMGKTVAVSLRYKTPSKLL